ncbi:PREDICTED: ankyrin-3-like isoform X2 [Populus euphratica]|uniref:Ankyrin-3-like isoform X2 n=1 Tax=Populus euphratica TaxID=75702 RepID=A0AAJ6UEG7_POPEU|nr:PREDICTED: ankyrin-3-like isoform X2 [Populus euphratica]
MYCALSHHFLLQESERKETRRIRMGRNRGGGGDTELHAAARSGDMKAVESIVSSNPLAINSRDKHSRTPLHLAAWSGQAEVVSYLCKHKADVGAAAMDDMGAIHFAAQKGHSEVVRTLLSSGASIKASTRKGLTPLHYAVQGSHLELVKYLVRKGASLTVRTKGGMTPLDLATNVEIHVFLEESERTPKKGTLDGKDKPEASEPKTSLQDKSENSGGEANGGEHEEQENGNVKRKGEEDDAKETSSEPKRARVALNHLLIADDTQEENL